jgi:magnesium transporter
MDSILSVLPQREPPEEPRREPVPLEAATVGCAVYVDGTRQPGDPDYRTAIDEALRLRAEGRAAFAWIGLREPDAHQMTIAAEVFDLHPLVVERVSHSRRRPSLHRFDHMLVLTLKTLHYIECDTKGDSAGREVVEFGDVMVVVGPHFVLTVRQGPHGELAELRRRMDQSPTMLTLGPHAVMHGIADHLVDTYRDVVDRIQVDVDALEAAVFAPNGGVDVERAYLLKGELAAMRHAIEPLTLELSRLLSERDEQVSKEVRRYLRAVLDRAQQLSDRIETRDDVLDSLWQATLDRIAVQQNEDVRKISAWVALAAVPTMLAAIYGMNFTDMPELHWLLGYPAVLTVMASVSGFLYWRFKRVHWL